MGDGVAGLSTACELVRTGRSVAVLEADRIASGATGYTRKKPLGGAPPAHSSSGWTPARPSWYSDQSRSRKAQQAGNMCRQGRGT
ncbi:FAD-dependent oxidoreductase [Streptomyces sp. NPDC057460]|uniref:FAD-dependent oxidoreductase n=1 Tax=Streptomyces sp. NPDC057460 TaxID=3346141 RepID=UPI0036901528